VKNTNSNHIESAETQSSKELINCTTAVDTLGIQSEEDNDLNIEAKLDEIIDKQWESEDEFAKFFIKASLSMVEGLEEGNALIFGHEITYSFYPGTSIWSLWTKAREFFETIEQASKESGCISEEMREQFNITSIFNIIPAALKESYGTQSLGEWLAHGYENFTHEDNEFLCTFIALIDDEDLLLDIASNLRNTTVLDELVFCRPDLIMTERILIGGYGGLLENPSLSSNALCYLSALFLGIPLPANYSSGTQEDTESSSPTESDVQCFREDHEELILELDNELIARAVAKHPNCSESLREQLESQFDPD
jgi:hypothetical protein